MRIRGVILGIFILLAALAVAFARHHKSVRSHESNSPVPAEVSSLFRALRPIFPYSVVPGGVYSPDELKSREQEDPLVRQHYADFELRTARLVMFNRDRFLYASYRKQNQIFWTKHKLRIPKGEVLLTDGTHLARTRCGNRLSESPGSPTTENEPIADLNLPQSITNPRITFANDSPNPESTDELPPISPLPRWTSFNLGPEPSHDSDVKPGYPGALWPSAFWFVPGSPATFTRNPETQPPANPLPGTPPNLPSGTALPPAFPEPIPTPEPEQLLLLGAIALATYGIACRKSLIKEGETQPRQ